MDTTSITTQVEKKISLRNYFNKLKGQTEERFVGSECLLFQKMWSAVCAELSNRHFDLA